MGMNKVQGQSFCTCHRRSSLDTRRTATRSSKARGQTLSINAVACPRSRTCTGGGGGRRQAHARTVPFWPRLDRACCGGSGVGERHRGVMGDGSRVVARCGSRRRALACTRTKQNAKRLRERIETHARHRVHAWSPSWHGQNDAQERTNLVYALDRAVFSLGVVIAHAQADQI